MHPSVGRMGKRYVCCDRESQGLFKSAAQIRLYYLGPGNVLHEYAYSASKDKNSLYYGNLHTLKIVLDPTSSIAAIRFEDDIICIYYQGQSQYHLLKASTKSLYQHRPEY